MSPKSGLRSGRPMLPFLMALSAVLTFGLAHPGSPCAAEDDEFSRQTLRGLKGIYLLIEEGDPDLAKAGLTRDMVAGEAEKRLRRIPVQLLTLKESFQETGRPYLEISLLFSKPSTGPYGYLVEVSLNQEIRPTRPFHSSVGRGTGILHGQTWRVREAGSLDRDKAPAFVETVGRMVDRFVDAYLAVNKDTRPN